MRRPGSQEKTLNARLLASWSPHNNLRRLRNLWMNSSSCFSAFSASLRSSQTKKPQVDLRLGCIRSYCHASDSRRLPASNDNRDADTNGADNNCDRLKVFGGHRSTFNANFDDPTILRQAFHRVKPVERIESGNPAIVAIAVPVLPKHPLLPVLRRPGRRPIVRGCRAPRALGSRCIRPRCRLRPCSR